MGRAKGHHHADKNAIRNKLLNQAKEGGTNKLHNRDHQGNAGDKHPPDPDMIRVADSRNDPNNEVNDVSTGVSMSRTSRSCFNSTAGPTGTTTVPPSANVSIAQPEAGDDMPESIRVINGNLAPPSRFNRTQSPPQTPGGQGTPSSEGEK